MVIAVGVATPCGFILFWVGMTLLSPTGGAWYVFVPAILLAFVIPQSIALSVYGYLTRRYYLSLSSFDGELHCRRCQYILRGITEPRCPECGERI